MKKNVTENNDGVIKTSLNPPPYNTTYLQTTPQTAKSPHQQ